MISLIIGIKCFQYLKCQIDKLIGELGRYPMYVKSKERSLLYWVKIMKHVDNPMHMCYVDQLQRIHVPRNNTWAFSLKSLLDNLGFSNIWSAFNSDVNYIPIFKQRLCDQYVQEWNTSITNQPKLDSYRLFKTEFKYEKYLDAVSNVSMRKEFSKLRLSSHCLEIETGRYVNIDRNERHCKCCNMRVVESEYHFMLCCPLYRELRQKYSISVSFPTLHKFVNIMSCKNTKTIRNISKYIYYALLKRQEKLETVPAS